MSIQSPIRAVQNQIVHATSILRRVEASDFPEPFRSEIIREVRRHFLRAVLRRGLWNARTLANPAHLAGYQISYRDFGILRDLYTEIFIDGIYLFRSGNDEPLILDCGSNIGMSVLFFKKLYPNARIVAFEPESANFSLLAQNIRQNALEKVKLLQAAVSDRTGTIEFFLDEERPGSLTSSVVQERGGSTRVTVPTVQLSNFISTEVDLLKIDVEGAEGSVLREIASAGKLRLVRQIHLEYHHHLIGQVDALSSILKLLEDHGFGYHLYANPPLGHSKFRAPGSFQDVMLYCYRKD